MPALAFMAPVLRHGDADMFDFIHGVSEGDPLFIALGVAIVGMVLFAAIQQWLTGSSFVKSKKERRRAYERRHHVIWKYERDDD